MVSEIAQLRIENAKLRKNILVRQNIMRGGGPSHLRSISIMFSDNKGFEQFAGPDYGSRTRAERAGFMSMEERGAVSEEHKIYQKNLHKFSNYPGGIGDKYFG
jgi:hypothetical protein